MTVRRDELYVLPIVVVQVMNDVVFPERVDFGVHALGETVRRTIKMVCKVGRRGRYCCTVRCRSCNGRKT